MQNILNNIKIDKLKIINIELVNSIKKSINNYFIKLNNEDKNILYNLTIYLIDIISYKFNFNDNNQWEINNYRDIKSIVLLLLPYIDDIKIKNLIKLTELLTIDIVELNPLHMRRDSSLLSYTNMIIDFNGDVNDDTIYSIIYNQFYGLLQTLEIMNGKYYVNWINIKPYNLENYYTSELYKDTMNLMTTLNLNNMNYYKGLWIGDIYNIISIKYYKEIKKLKWLLFPYETIDESFYLLQGLHKIFDLNILLNNNYNNYYDLSDIDKLNFNNKYLLLIDNLLYNNSYFNLMTIDFNIIKYLLIYFKSSNNSNSIFNISNLYEITDINDDYDKKIINIINKITNNNIINELKLINIAELWNYLKDILNQFKNTAYYKFLITNNKINDYYYYKPFNEEFKKTDNYNNNIKNKLNLKNIYNIAKTLSHDDNFILLPSNYISFNTEHINLLLSRLNINNNNNWLNFINNIKKQMYKKYSYQEVINNILIAFLNSYLILVFEELITNGILSYFNPILNINDKKIYKKEIFKTDFSESYYYLNNTKFKDLKKINNKHYFDFICSDLDWIFYFAMNWIAQINFFQHYIYHQVIYITGATGQGKSTQIPKLLLYALKVIDYKNNGRIICTQPRIDPTVNNAKRIAEELGLPIEDKQTQLKLNNYNIQFKHQKDKHTNTNIYQNILKITTDGVLLEEIKKNIIMKKIYNNKYINENIYDIIIVDESHEHNINMDLITTMARQTCFLNNQIRFIIVSATMDDDELIYRSYFRMINDNLLYPIKNEYNNEFMNNILVNNTKIINSYFIDRRMHISPPGETTQHKVTDIYLNESYDNIKEPQRYEIITNKCYDIVIDICNKTPKGEVLIFTNGANDIIKMVKYLNQILPPSTIVLPFHAGLHPNYKDIISNIDKKIKYIKNKKENVHIEWSEKFIEDKNVMDNIYNRAVIIATNVAEASITISTLKFVIDNGYAKNNAYDTDINKSTLITNEISESSRIQRRGRVGRVTDGTVYYTYKYKGRAYNKTKYKITLEDITPILIDLLCKDDYYTDINLLVSLNELTNPNSILFHETNVTNTTDFYFTSNLYNINKINYMIYNNHNNYYLNNLIDFDNEIEIKPFMVYRTGQHIDNILDKYGKFYLIHYLENIINRNILNSIINCRFDTTNQIPDNNFNKIINNLKYKQLIITHENNIIYSNFYNLVSLIKSELSYEIEDSIVIIYSYLLNCYDDVYDILYILKKNIILKDFIIKNIYSDSNSDILIIYNIFNNFKKCFNNLLLFTINNNIKLEQENIIKNIISNTYNDNISNKLMNDITFINYYNNLQRNNEIYNNNSNSINIDKFDNIYTYYNDYIINDLNNNEETIKKWCFNNYIDYDIFNNYIKLLTENLLENKKNKVLNILKDYFNDIYESNTDNIENNIIQSFMHGYPFNIAYRVDNNYIGIIDNFLTEIKWKDANTLINKKGSLIFYYNYQKNKILNSNRYLDVSIISNINVELLTKILPLYYNPSNFNNYSFPYNKIINNNNNNNIIEIKNIDYININSNIVSEYYNLCMNISNVWNHNNLLNKLHNYFDKLRNYYRKLITNY
jgi:DNA-binding protein Fis